VTVYVAAWIYSHQLCVSSVITSTAKLVPYLLIQRYPLIVGSSIWKPTPMSHHICNLINIAVLRDLIADTIDIGSFFPSITCFQCGWKKTHLRNTDCWHLAISTDYSHSHSLAIQYLELDSNTWSLVHLRSQLRTQGWLNERLPLFLFPTRIWRVSDLEKIEFQNKNQPYSTYLCAKYYPRSQERISSSFTWKFPRPKALELIERSLGLYL
jgi:hypothetical protein